MGIYCFSCDDHEDEKADAICLHAQIDDPERPRRPHCPVCGKPMGRDYQAERFGGITNRSKGVYPMVDDGIDPQGREVVINDYQHHKRLMKENGLRWHERTPESYYSRKHVKDRG